MTTRQIENWKLSYIENKKLLDESFAPTTGKEVKERLSSISASVPGNFELDLMREKLLPDVYYGTNALLTQKLENLHLFYYTEFSYAADEQTDDFLVFKGVDTFADIYLDGKKMGFVENMLHEHEFSLQGLKSGVHDLLVHIYPTQIYARQYDLPAMCFGQTYNSDAMEIRKAPYMFGWDIMPRILSGGLWKPVVIEKRNKSRIAEPFSYTEQIEQNGTAFVKTSLKIVTDEDFIHDFYVKATFSFNGVICAETKMRCFSAHQRLRTFINDAKLWMPKNYGEPNMYDVKIELLKDYEVVDTVNYRIGIRKVQLLRTSCSGDDGEFCFKINGQKIFCLGSNHVPTDAFPSRQESYDLRAVQLVKEVGCNMIRCWGGNIYPSQKLYDFCDENGIMVWQDFSFGCGHYPDDERLCRLTKEEVKSVAIAYRNHPSLVLWAGDNECDTFVSPDFQEEHSVEGPSGYLNPNQNVLSRNIILHELRNHDATRPYLPSSPYLDDTAFHNGLPSEDHLWGPRDYFKGEFYRNTVCHFASETGYHGCNSPKSVEKFIPKESIGEMGTSKGGCANPDWLVHAAGMETITEKEGNPFAYRIPLMISQVERIFTEKRADLEGFAMQSQISQAEAVKYFIERFRVRKWRKTGIIWWNVIDGWPQISDAIVDWYGCKKLAFHYIRRSQNSFAIMLDEPENGKMKLFAVNDLQTNVNGKYVVKNLSTGETVVTGEFNVDKNGVEVLTELPELDHAFYVFEWETNVGNGINHHACSLGDKWDVKAYTDNMKKAGFFGEFEGFDKI